MNLFSLNIFFLQNTVESDGDRDLCSKPKTTFQKKHCELQQKLDLT